jgi:hypothetical protein
MPADLEGKIKGHGRQHGDHAVLVHRVDDEGQHPEQPEKLVDAGQDKEGKASADDQCPILFPQHCQDDDPKPLQQTDESVEMNKLNGGEGEDD